jgi:DNA polymerase III epsilon subunit-like protein
MDPLFPQIQLQRPPAFVDLETTALSVAHARITDIAVLKLRPNDRPQRFAARLNPQVPIPSEAAEVHGIRDRDEGDADVRQGLPPPARAVPGLRPGRVQPTDPQPANFWSAR